MNLIRKVLGYLYFIYGIILFFITLLLVFLPIILFSKFKEPEASQYIHSIFKGWMQIFMNLVGCPVKTKGIENFKNGENYVVVCNHNSFVDIPVSSPWIPGANKTLAKIEMTKIPLFGAIYKSGSILVDRKNEKSRRESFLKMQETLSKGLHLCLYPEGTRNNTQKPLQPFYDGAFITAIQAQKAVIPALIFNTKTILPLNPKFWARPHKIHFHFLPPVSTIGMTLADVSNLKLKVHTIMEQYYIANKELLK